MRIFASIALAAVLAGCANLKVVSDFANETIKLTGTVSAEFAQLESLCVTQANLSIAILGIEEDSPDSPLKGCTSYSATQGRLAEVTVETLEAYGRTLTALAENKSFDLGPELKATSSKLAGLRDKQGHTLLDEKQLGALTKVLILLADISTQSMREEAIKRLIAEEPNVVISAQLLRSFFALPASSPAGIKTPYDNLVALSSDALRSYEVLLKSEAVRKAEPIRARELYLGMNSTRLLLKQRQTGADDSVAKKIVNAIDAWIAAADAFAREALQPDALQLYDRLKDLREKAVEARDAVGAQSK